MDSQRGRNAIHAPGPKTGITHWILETIWTIFCGQLFVQLIFSPAGIAPVKAARFRKSKRSIEIFLNSGFCLIPIAYACYWLIEPSINRRSIHSASLSKSEVQVYPCKITQNYDTFRAQPWANLLVQSRGHLYQLGQIYQKVRHKNIGVAESHCRPLTGSISPEDCID